MKLLRVGMPGFEKPALLDEQGALRDLSGVIGDVCGQWLLPEVLERLQALNPEMLPVLPADQLRVGPCVGQVGKLICIGLNYSDHAAETGAAAPDEPVIFGKWTSAITGPYDEVYIPRGSTHTDWEVELGVVIGQPGRYIEEENALAHVAGYCVVNDISEREYQMRRGGTWDKGKGCDTFAPIGPWLVTADEVPDPQQLSIWLEVDGKRYQDDTTANMIFKVPYLISYVSQFMSLQPGDIIATGTPPGVGLGQKPPVFLQPGQTMRLGVQGLGEQKLKVVSTPLTGD
jgi:2-keto-4-pentenoate hydratase/2-oxohepta-3-ene-1,7-dioic acid hydratase in catechol pathway